MGHIKQFICFVFCLFLVAASTFRPVFADRAVDCIDSTMATIYKENNILFWNPCEGKTDNCEEAVDYGNTDYVEMGDDNASTIFSYLVQNGFSTTAAAAIMGNLANEAGSFNPKQLEIGKNSSYPNNLAPDDFVAWQKGADGTYESGKKTFSGGLGIAQWTWPSRVMELQRFADSKGLPVTSLSVQVQYLYQELTGKISASELNAMSYKDAVRYVLEKYENPSDISERELNERVTSGEDYLSMTPSGVSLDEDGCVTKNYDSIGEDIGISLDDEEAYNQCDPRWGSIAYGTSDLCHSGCGPSALAMIISFLTGRSVTPADTVKIANENGYYTPGLGSSWNISKTVAEAYGLQHEYITATESNAISAITSYLEKGYMISTSGYGKLPYSSSDKGTKGHFIAIVGITSDGKWKVASSSGGGSVKAYDPVDVVGDPNHKVVEVRNENGKDVEYVVTTGMNLRNLNAIRV